ncbi:MAG: DUF547 domain-containing protein [Bacteroidota bacterium]
MKYLLFGLLMAAIFISCDNQNESSDIEIVDEDRSAAELSYIETSQALLQALRDDNPTDEYTQKLANVSQADLNAELQTDEEKLAFWVNVYNSYIILTLADNPDLYNDRNEFFKKDQVQIAGETLSFDKIEHGIIRNSTVKLSKGYLPDIFPGEFEKEFRVEEIDPRIHFVLNCGAKDCPPVYIYSPETLDEDFNQVASAYLNRVSTFDIENNIVKTTPLFNWFTGDWGGKDGVKDMLHQYEILPAEHEDVEIEWKGYDWTMDIDNFG